MPDHDVDVMSLRIPVPEPNLTPDEIVARAAGFRERLRAEQDVMMQRTQLAGAHGNLERWGGPLARAYLFDADVLGWKDARVV